MRRLFMACVLAGLASGAGAQAVFKCQDAEGRTIYVEDDCAIQGLREIEEAWSPPVESRDETPLDPQIRPCRSDARLFCNGLQAASGAVVGCLIDHENDISEDCYQALKAKLDHEGR